MKQQEIFFNNTVKNYYKNILWNKNIKQNKKYVVKIISYYKYYFIL